MRTKILFSFLTCSLEYGKCLSSSCCSLSNRNISFRYSDFARAISRASENTALAEQFRWMAETQLLAKVIELKVAEELKQFATSLSLSDDQKQKLHNFLTEAREKVQAYRKDNPNASQQDLVNHVKANRSALRERLVNFLTPEQLTKWDAEVAKAKEFLGHKMAASA
jgi:hypothetical protein